MMTKKEDAARKRKQRRERFEAGLCVYCGKLPQHKGNLCPECYNKDLQRRARLDARVRAEVFAAYGNKCYCCGEDGLAFLTIDHKMNNGTAHRKELGIRAGTKFYHWIKRNKFPDYLQILCWNCNLGKLRNNGVCPHEP